MFTTIDAEIANTANLILNQPSDLILHSKAVAGLAVQLSLVAGCSPAQVERIRLGSLLHDIGKQFILQSILEKEGRLTRTELALIKEHPQLGYNYLNNFLFDATVLQTVLHHHERWNGTGYPLGLKEDRIPLEARICAIVDVWDALVSDRCYRKGWDISYAMDWIWAGAGSLFDPMLARQFLEIVEDQHLGIGVSSLQKDTAISVKVPFLPVTDQIQDPPTQDDSNNSPK